MTPLRNQMIEAMAVRGFSDRTHQSYLRAVTGLAAYYHQSPAALNLEQIRRYLVYLAVERGLAWSSCHQAFSGIRFLYRQVLHRRFDRIGIALPKRKQRIPELLNHTEVAAILRACHNRKHRMMLSLCYGCGLRVTELVQLRVSDIDGEQGQLRITQGKGGKDRLMPLGPTLLNQLRRYWCRQRPAEWLFPGARQSAHLSVSTIQKSFHRVKALAGVTKTGGIHGLRHAYATHQLEAGLPVHRLQRLLGHRDLHTTLRYIHWVPNRQEGDGAHDLLADLEVHHV